jgi:hypothetical protein
MPRFEITSSGTDEYIRLKGKDQDDRATSADLIDLDLLDGLMYGPVDYYFSKSNIGRRMQRHLDRLQSRGLVARSTLPSKSFSEYGYE